MKYFLPLVLCMIFISGVLRAQTTGTLIGRVVDSAGRPLPGATVIVVGTSPARGALTKTDGTYRIAGIRAGKYLISVKTIRFESRERDSVVISVDRETRLDVRLWQARVFPQLVGRPASHVQGGKYDSVSRTSIQDVVRADTTVTRPRGILIRRPEPSIRIDGVAISADSTRPDGGSDGPK